MGLRRSERTGAPIATLALALLLTTPEACTKLKLGKKSTAARPKLPVPSAIAIAASAEAKAAASAVAAANAAVEASRVAAIARARQLVTDIRWMVTKGVTVNPAKAGEGDVATKCDAVEAARTELGKRPDPELVKALDEGAALCAFDVPLLTASESLDHLRGTPSQASHLLMCTVAEREISKARAVRPNDARVHREDARRATLCK